jgi:outer membrane protein TolC
MRISRFVVSTVLFGFAMFAANSAARAGDAIANAPVLELRALIDAVLARHPNVEAARLAWQAAAQRPARAGTLEQPTIAYGFAPSSLGSSVAFGQAIELSQRLARGATRELRRRAAAAEARALGEDLGALRLELARATALLFVDYSLSAEALRLNREHVDLLEDLLRSTTSRYAAGLGSQQDPLEAEAELAHALHEGVRLATEQRILAAKLNTLLRRAPDAPLAPPATLNLGDRVSDAPPAPGHQPPRAAGEERPELRSLGFMVEAERAELEITRRAGRPEPTVTASYNSMWSDAEHRWMVGGSWSVPLWRKGLRAAVAGAEVEVARAEALLASKELEIQAEVWQAAERVRESEHLLELFESRMLPAARDRVKAASAGLGAGTNDFGSVIEAERALREVELGYSQALADRERNAIELEFASGRLVEPSRGSTDQESIPTGDPS